jgi:hypothetical protein
MGVLAVSPSRVQFLKRFDVIAGATMGAALFPVFEKPVEDFDPSVEVSGKALSRHSQMIDEACKQLGIKTLWDFYEESPEEVQNHLVEELSPELAETLAIEPLRWFTPSDCIAMIQTLRAHLTKQTGEAVAAVIVDLNALECVLNRAVKEGTRFRLALDI